MSIPVQCPPSTHHRIILRQSKYSKELLSAEDLLALQETDLSLQSQLVDAVSNVDAFGNRILDLETLTDIVRISGPGEGGFLNTMIGVSAEAGDPAAENRIVLGYLAEGITNNTVMLGNQNITAVMPHALGSCSLGTADNPFTEVHCSDMYSSGDLNINNIAVTGNIATAGLTSTGIVSTTISSEFVTASDSLSTPLLKSTTKYTGAVKVEIVNDTFDGSTLLNGGAVLHDASFVPSSGQVTLMSDVPQQTGVLNYTGNLGGNWSIETDFRYTNRSPLDLFCIYTTVGFPAANINYDNHGGYSFAINFYGTTFPVLIRYDGQSIPGANKNSPFLSEDTTYTNRITCVGGIDFTYRILNGSTEMFKFAFTDIDRGPQSYFGAFGKNSTDVSNIFVERMLVTADAKNTSIALGSSEIDMTGELRVNGVSITDQLQNITASPGVTDFVGEVIGTDITCDNITTGGNLTVTDIVANGNIELTGELRVNGVSITDQLQNITASPGVTDFVGNIIVGGNMSVDNNLRTDSITNLFNTVEDISVFADSFTSTTLANGGVFLTQTSLPTPGIPAIDTVNEWVQLTSETIGSSICSYNL